MKKTYILLTMVVLTLSCKKDDPVTPSSSPVIFYTATTGPAIDVWLDGANDPVNPSGTINAYWPTGTPDCYASGAYTTSLATGTHTYNAKPKGGQKFWSGTFTVDKGVTCQPLRFDR